MIIKISTSSNYHPNFLIKKNLKKADWDGYRKTLEDRFSNFTLLNKFQEGYDAFIHEINTAADSHIPFIRTSLNLCSLFVPKPYWNVDLSKAVAERRLALKHFRRNPNPNNLVTLQSKVRTAQKLIRQAKRRISGILLVIRSSQLYK